MFLVQCTPMNTVHCTACMMRRNQFFIFTHFKVQKQTSRLITQAYRNQLRTHCFQKYYDCRIAACNARLHLATPPAVTQAQQLQLMGLIIQAAQCAAFLAMLRHDAACSMLISTHAGRMATAELPQLQNQLTCTTQRYCSTPMCLQDLSNLLD